MPVVNALSLSDDQIEMLTEVGVQLERIFTIKGERLHHNACRIDGYVSDRYVFFVDGEMRDHVVFLNFLFGGGYAPQIVSKFRGIAVYGDPARKFATAENLVQVNGNPANSTISY